MGLLDRLRALLRRPRREQPVGRHSRVLPGPTVPGAAAVLVASTGTAGVVQADAEQPAVAPSPPSQPVAPAQPAPPVPPVEPVTAAADDADAVDAVVAVVAPVAGGPDPEPLEPHPDLEPSGQPAPTQPSPTEPAVMLGFADGGQVALDPDDPRVRVFTAAAQALLEEPRS